MKFQFCYTVCALAATGVLACTHPRPGAGCVDPVPRDPTISRHHFVLPHDSGGQRPIVVVSLQSADAPTGQIYDAQVVAESLSEPSRAVSFTEIPARSGHYITRAPLPPGPYVLRTLAIGYHRVVDTIHVVPTTSDSVVYRTYVTPQCNEVIPTMLPNDR